MRISTLVCLLYSVITFGQGTPDFLDIASGFTQPVAIANAGDGTNRLFIVERAGVIRIIDLHTGQVLPTPFLDITSQVESSGGEEGMLGLAFHPEYQDSGYFYVYYIFPEGGDLNAPDSTKVARFKVSDANSNIADPGSEYRILSFDQPANNHNAGDMHFGPDGYLYIASGDGGGAGGSGSGHSQDSTNLLGKILRIDVDSDDFPADGEKNYSIPTGNPYSTSLSRNEIWHLGLRNPWKFSFDRLNGDMYIADVGQNDWEEIDVAMAGEKNLNFGWKCREGAHQYNGLACGSSAVGFEEPVFEYDHGEGRSVTGGFVYRGNNFDNFKGWYFFADFAFSKLWQFQGPTAANPTTPINSISSPSSFGESESGEMYIASYGGTIYKIIDRSVCPPTQSLAVVSNAINLAEISLSSTATLGAGDFSFFAGDFIQLNADFSVPIGTSLHVEIGACGTP